MNKCVWNAHEIKKVSKVKKTETKRGGGNKSLLTHTYCLYDENIVWLLLPSGTRACCSASLAIQDLQACEPISKSCMQVCRIWWTSCARATIWQCSLYQSDPNRMSFAHFICPDCMWNGWSKQQSYTCSSWQCIVGWHPKQRLYSFRQRKMIILPINAFTSCPLPFLCLVESNGMDPMIKEQHKVVWIFHLHIHGHGCVAYTLARSTVFEMKKVNSVLCEWGGANNWGGWCFLMHFEYSSPFCRSQ